MSVVSGAGQGKQLRSKDFSLTATGSVVDAVPGRRIKVFAVKLIVDSPINVHFRSGSTPLEGDQALAANGGYIEQVQPPAFLFASNAGDSLDLAISGAGIASGRVSYWDEDSE